MDEQSIFTLALDKNTTEEREAFLDEVCAGDARLRADVTALLRAHDAPDSFLESLEGNVLQALEKPAAAERPGTLIGPYKLIELIGEGGMGLVYVAEQQKPVRRQVALKIIKPGMDTREVIGRFEAERQALALMDHRNIARVLDAGTIDDSDEGGRIKDEKAQSNSSLILHPSSLHQRPYFVMELVKGVSITEYCDQHDLDTRARLSLFATVCDAVQHAHQKGIIHRDLKPSNVLVTVQDGVPVVKVIDFGIAKAIGQSLTDRTLHTAASQIIGTPLYMSPEQAELGGIDIDTRTDVYSLGVLLYELLTGTTPFDQARLRQVSYDEMRRIIREEDPPRPSTRLTTLSQQATVSTRPQRDPRQLSRLIRGELDWIVMKALEKDRGRRYATAIALGADVQHYLHDEPVSACPPSAWYRFGKMARRNKRPLAAAGLVALALVVGTAVSLWQAVRATLAMSSEQQALLDLAEEQKATRRELGRAEG